MKLAFLKFTPPNFEIFRFSTIVLHIFSIFSSACLLQTVNIPNAYKDDRFDPKVDDDGSFKHKTILCMAIKNSSGQIIGVIQVRNKLVLAWLQVRQDR